MFAATATEFQDTPFLPGNDRVPGAFIHLIAAETLKRGTPVDIGWFPGLLFAALALLGGALLRRARWFNGIALTTIGLMIAGKIALMTMLVSSSIGAGLFLIAAIGANVSRTRRRRSAQRANQIGRAHV